MNFTKTKFILRRKEIVQKQVVIEIIIFEDVAGEVYTRRLSMRYPDEHASFHVTEDTYNITSLEAIKYFEDVVESMSEEFDHFEESNS